MVTCFKSFRSWFVCAYPAVPLLRPDLACRSDAELYICCTDPAAIFDCTSIIVKMATANLTAFTGGLSLLRPDYVICDGRFGQGLQRAPCEAIVERLNSGSSPIEYEIGPVSRGPHSLPFEQNDGESWSCLLPEILDRVTDIKKESAR